MAEVETGNAAGATATAENAGSGAGAGVDLAAFKSEVAVLADAETKPPSAEPAETVAADAATEAVETTEGEGAEAAPADEAKAPEAGTGQFAPTPRQIDLAKQLGMTDDQITALTPDTAALIDQLGTAQSRKMSELGRKQQELAAAAAKPPQAQEAPAATGEVGELTDFTYDDWGSEEGQVKLNTLVTTVKTLNETVEALRTAQAERETEQTYDAVDRFFGGLDADTFPQFGKGGAAELDPDGGEYKARDALCAKATEIKAGYALLRDGAEMALDAALDEALRIVASEQITGQVERKVKKKVAARSSQLIAKPTQQTGRADHRTPEQRAEDAIREKAAKRGIALG